MRLRVWSRKQNGVGSSAGGLNPPFLLRLNLFLPNKKLVKTTKSCLQGELVVLKAVLLVEWFNRQNDKTKE